MNVIYFYAKYLDKGKPYVEKFCEEHNLELTEINVDEDLHAMKEYGLPGTPPGIVVMRDNGSILYKGKGTGKEIYLLNRALEKENAS